VWKAPRTVLLVDLTVTVVVEWTCDGQKWRSRKGRLAPDLVRLHAGLSNCPLHCQFTNSFIFADSVTLSLGLKCLSSISLLSVSKMRTINQIIIILIIYLHFRLGQGVLRHEHALLDQDRLNHS
jgi:hypothetical protein